MIWWYVMPSRVERISPPGLAFGIPSIRLHHDAANLKDAVGNPCDENGIDEPKACAMPSPAMELSRCRVR